MAHLKINTLKGQRLNLEDLRHEHSTLDTRLKQLEAHRSLSPQEQYEKAIIKKRKLAIKDRIRHMS